MARIKETWEARYVKGSMRAEGKNQVVHNVALVRDPERVIRVTYTVSELEDMLREARREKERSAARDIFNLGV